MPGPRQILSSRAVVLLFFNHLGEPASSWRVRDVARAYGFELKSGTYYPEVTALHEEGLLASVSITAKALNSNYPHEKFSRQAKTLFYLTTKGEEEADSIKLKLSVFAS